MCGGRNICATKPKPSNIFYSLGIFLLLCLVLLVLVRQSCSSIVSVSQSVNQSAKKGKHRVEVGPSSSLVVRGRMTLCSC